MRIRESEANDCHDAPLCVTGSLDSGFSGDTVRSNEGQALSQTPTAS